MLAEHDLVSDLAFANPNGHIPSSQFEISMRFAVLCSAGQTASSFIFCRLTLRALLSDTQNMVETDGIEPTT